MHCPFCRSTDTRVLDSRVADDGGRSAGAGSARPARRGSHRRADAADRAQAQWRDRAVHPREGDLRGPKACKGRPVSEDDLACLGQSVEDAFRGEGWAEVPANEVGLAILGPLRELDDVAYLRFASVYKAFESAPTTSRPRSRCSGPRARSTTPRQPTSADRLTTTARCVVGKPRAGPTNQNVKCTTEGKRHTHDRDGEREAGTSRKRAAKGGAVKIQRIFTTQGVHPFDELNWERRDVVQTNWKTGETVFEQRGVEFPDFWSLNASTIVTTKYFRGAVGTDAREWSLKQLSTGS